MKRNKTTRTIAIGGALLIFATALLTNFNLEKHYRQGEYVSTENAYFVKKIDSEAGLVKAKKFVVPTDNNYSTQKTRSLGSALIGDIESVWSSYTGEGTTIAIIDDGFDYNHPEYTRSDGTSAILSTSRYYYVSGNSIYYQSYSKNPNCIAEDWESDGEGGYEWASHGTATSTTAAAPINNVGGVGIAPDANILALKIDFNLATIEAAINYAVAQKVDVINMSLGAYAETFTDGWGDTQSGYPSTATYLNSACQAAYDAGVIVVAAAGNEATWHKSYPASNSKVIGVGALGDWTNKGNANRLAEFTNYVGASQTGEVNVDILAPGYVYTAHLSGTQYSPTHTYADTQGTSFSSPIVAGAAALWKQKHPNGTPYDFLNELQSTADGIGEYTNKMIPVSDWASKLNDVGPSNITNGRLNVANLLDMANPYVTTTQSNLNIAIGEERQIGLNTYNGTITYNSSDSSIATVSNSGLVKGKSAGNTTIVVTATKNGKTATANIGVSVSYITSASSISFDPSEITLNIGENYNSEETLVVTPSNASRIFLFESDDESVATVDIETGLVTAIGPGTAEIYAISVYGSADDSLTVTVIDTASHEGVINFGNATGSLKIDSSSKSGTDNLNNTWKITTTGTTSFTQGATYSQIGSKDKPASNIEFKMTLSSVYTFTSVSASFGGNTDSSAAVSIKVDSTVIGSGSVPSSADKTITNSSTASGNSLIIYLSNISKGIKAYSISYEYESVGDIKPPTLEGVEVSNNKTYHPGETINKNDISVNLVYSNGDKEPRTDFIFGNDGYMFTYDDTTGGGLNKSKQFSIVYEGDSYNFSVNVSRVAYIASSGTTKTLSANEFESSDLSKSSGTASNSAVTIGGVNFTVTTNAYVYKQQGANCISFGSAPGSINNTNPFGSELTAVTVIQHSSSRQDGVLLISKNGVDWTNYSSSEIAKGGYLYFKYAYTSEGSGSGATKYSNIQSISYTLSGQDSANMVANYIMYEDTNDQCLTKLDTAINKLNSMSNTDKNIFWTSEDYVIATARERIMAWARHNKKELTYNNDVFQISNANYISDFFNANYVADFIPLIVISLIGVFTIGGYYFLKRKKEY